MRNDRRQQNLAAKLSQLGFSELIFGVGYFFEKTLEIIRQEADRVGFPVVETPPKLLFVNTTKAILKRIVNQQDTLLHIRTLAIYDTKRNPQLLASWKP